MEKSFFGNEIPSPLLDGKVKDQMKMGYSFDD
jgi:hypothetical protein